MDAGALCSRKVITVAATDELVHAARVMREQHVGFLIVTEARTEGSQAPVGVLTDRDIVVAVVAREVSPASLSVGDVMTRRPAVARDTDSLDSVLGKMRASGVRRLPVVDAGERLIGIVALDDVLNHVAAQLTSIAASIRQGRHVERQQRS